MTWPFILIILTNFLVDNSCFTAVLYCDYLELVLPSYYFKSCTLDPLSGSCLFSCRLSASCSCVVFCRILGSCERLILGIRSAAGHRIMVKMSRYCDQCHTILFKLGCNQVIMFYWTVWMYNMQAPFFRCWLITAGVLAAPGGVEFRWAHLIPSWE